MKSWLYIAPILLIILCQCSQESRQIKSIAWVSVRGDEESPYKFEYFNKNGILIYDSTLFISGMGYRINRYSNGNVILSKAIVKPDILELLENEYDDQNNLLNSKIITSRDTNIFIYKNVYDEGNLLLDILIYSKGDTTPISIDHRSYVDSLLIMETTCKKINVDSCERIREKRYGYDEMGRIAYVVTTDYQQVLVDSVVMNFNLREKKIFRSIHKAGYEMISVEKVLKNDSSEIEIQQPTRNKTILVKKKNVEFW